MAPAIEILRIAPPPKKILDSLHKMLSNAPFGIKTRQQEEEKKLTSRDAFGYARHPKMNYFKFSDGPK